MFIVRGERSQIRAACQAARRMCEVTGLAIAAIAFAAGAALATEKPDPAHEIANRFADEGKPATAKRPSTTAPTVGATTSGTRKTPARPPVSQTAPARLDPIERGPAETPTPETVTPATPAKAAGEADSQARDAELQKAYEEEMLARAKAEAEARARTELQREERAARERAAAQASAGEKAERERQERGKAAMAEQARRALEEEKARIAREDELQRQRDAELRAAQDKAAQREQESRRLTERLRAARQAREEERVRKQAEAAEAEVRRAEQTRRASQAMRKRADHLAMRLEANRRARLAAERLQSPPGTAINPDATSPIATGSTHELPPTVKPAASNRATILLVMTPGRRGIRRWNKNADPMLCVEDNCYISRGEDQPADRMSRNKGFGPGIALGKRAGACSNQLACVFRDINLVGTRAWMQPVDLRILRHDRRESRMIAADPTCSLAHGRLDCRQTVESEDYRAWIVPEAVAREAGPAVLHEALQSGLGVSHAAVMRRD